MMQSDEVTSNERVVFDSLKYEEEYKEGPDTILIENAAPYDVAMDAVPIVEDDINSPTNPDILSSSLSFESLSMVEAVPYYTILSSRVNTMSGLYSHMNNIYQDTYDMSVISTNNNTMEDINESIPMNIRMISPSNSSTHTTNENSPDSSTLPTSSSTKLIDVSSNTPYIQSRHNSIVASPISRKNSTTSMIGSTSRRNSTLSPLHGNIGSTSRRNSTMSMKSRRNSLVPDTSAFTPTSSSNSTGNNTYQNKIDDNAPMIITPLIIENILLYGGLSLPDIQYTRTAMCVLCLQKNVYYNAPQYNFDICLDCFRQVSVRFQSTGAIYVKTKHLLCGLVETPLFNIRTKKSQYCDLCTCPGVKYSCIEHHFDICETCFISTSITVCRHVQSKHHTCMLTITENHLKKSMKCDICRNKGVKYSCVPHAFHICKICFQQSDRGLIS